MMPFLRTTRGPVLAGMALAALLPVTASAEDPRRSVVLEETSADVVGKR
jgi:hypothetical protein